MNEENQVDRYESPVSLLALKWKSGVLHELKRNGLHWILAERDLSAAHERKNMII